MNSRTKRLLIKYIDEVKDFAYSVSSISGTDALIRIVEAGERLKTALEKDETILEIK